MDDGSSVRGERPFLNTARMLALMP